MANALVFGLDKRILICVVKDVKSKLVDPGIHVEQICSNTTITGLQWDAMPYPYRHIY